MTIQYNIVIIPNPQYISINQPSFISSTYIYIYTPKVSRMVKLRKLKFSLSRRLYYLGEL